MSDVNWTMNEDTIVRRVDDTAAQSTLPDPSLEKVKQGERMRFDAHVNVEMMPQGKHLKKVTIFSNVPDGGTWEVISDEGTAVGGRGTAPSPLMYFAAGLGLCLMSHVEMLAKGRGFRIDGARLEQRSTWTTTLDLGAVSPQDVFGKAEGMEMNLLIDSPESPARIAEFVGYCRQACMALQAIAAETPVVTGLYLNGQEVGEVGGTGAFKAA
ncbi:OsmC family protein [Pontivivens ytuae]|uniref:OsmC family protein n=1 Tax=Pontivivens ytuae TaxID=2789856 RepID=A0A7S9LS12_9RHOB|nr:OsmC family protein [Pontivivens ytuae]QPH54234.1 OsmC family protein [Pontivivens ytuae]